MTGVQTCALPIYINMLENTLDNPSEDTIPESVDVAPAEGLENVGARSEERRVGKECRSRWSPYH